MRQMEKLHSLTQDYANTSGQYPIADMRPGALGFLAPTTSSLVRYRETQECYKSQRSQDQNTATKKPPMVFTDNNKCRFRRDMQVVKQYAE